MDHDTQTKQCCTLIENDIKRSNNNNDDDDNDDDDEHDENHTEASGDVKSASVEAIQARREF